jgi:hypothetical protein
MIITITQCQYIRIIGSIRRLQGLSDPPDPCPPNDDEIIVRSLVLKSILWTH